MKNKVMILMIGILVVAATGGFFAGRYFTIRRTASYFAKEMPKRIPVEDLRSYRKQMEQYRKLLDKERQELTEAVKKDEIDKVRKHIDSLSRIKRELLMNTCDEIRRISKALPPEIRKSFIEHRLKKPKRPPLRKSLNPQKGGFNEKFR
ncbi:MAG: hypothetical protein U9N06_04475 [candidate division WOR-3 bacterium]|nr:hypothetical protein [candidate division WOR-3 bacterium]